MINETSSVAVETTREARMSRRDFGRRAALAAVAVAICENAQAAPFKRKRARALETNRLKISALNTDNRCKNFLNLLEPGADTLQPDGKDKPSSKTIKYLLYEPMQNLVSDLYTEELKSHGSTALSASLLRVYDLIRGNQDIRLHHLYTHDEDNNPLAWTKWRDLQFLMKDPVLRDNISMPFFYLLPRSTDVQRQEIEELLRDSGTKKYNFEARLGAYKYLDLFCESRNKIFYLDSPDPQPDPSNVMIDRAERLARYHLVRRAFDLGVFKLESANLLAKFDAEGEYDAEIVPNNLCYSHTTGKCEVVTGKYCEIANGEPTSSCDICD